MVDRLQGIARVAGIKKLGPRGEPSDFWQAALAFDQGAGARLLPTEPNVLLRLPPTVVTAPMITTEIKAAMRPYSMAVAPDSSFRKFAKLFMCILSVLCGPAPYGRFVRRPLCRAELH